MTDISVGAIGAAAIAGIISLLGLIISKEQKTSEFRQAWIDALRTEITTYLTGLNAIADAARVKYASHAEKVRALSPHYSRLNQATFGIALRVNPKERRSQILLECIAELQELAVDEHKLTPEHIRPIEARLLSSSQDLLKFEWGRVKRGELTFVVAKFVSLALVIAALVYGGLLMANEIKPDSPSTSPPAAEKQIP